MSVDYRKKTPTGTLRLDPDVARDIGTGIGQTVRNALISGERRTEQVMRSMPERQKQCLTPTSGYGEQLSKVTDAQEQMGISRPGQAPSDADPLVRDQTAQQMRLRRFMS
jgi:hypothetical protein